MNIGLFTTDFPFRGPFSTDDPDLVKGPWGGVAEVTYDLALHLNSIGASVKVFTTSPIKDDIFQAHENIEVFRYGWRYKVENTLLAPGMIWRPLRHELDVVHSHLGTPPGAFSGYWYSVMKQTPMLLTIHTAYTKGLYSDRSFMKELSFDLFDGMVFRTMLKRANVTTAVSRSVVDESPSCHKFADSIRIVPNGVRPMAGQGVTKKEARDELGIGENELVLLYMGNISLVKCPALLIDTFARVVADGEDAVLFMVGEGSLREDMKAKVHSMGLDDRIKLPGFMAGAEKDLYFRSADLFVLPSKSESFGMVAAEALFYGLPLLLSDLDAFRELFEDGENALFFRTMDDEDLYRKMRMLIEDQELREGMGRNNGKLAGYFDLSKVMKSYEEIYQRLVGDK